VNGSIIVKGTLIVNHTELIMGLKSDGEHKILVDGGTLIVNGSTVKSNSTYRFMIQISNGIFEFINSTFKNLGYSGSSTEFGSLYPGMYINSSSGKMINVTIYSAGGAFYLNETSNIHVENVTLYSESEGPARPAFEIYDSNDIWIENFTALVSDGYYGVDGPFVIKWSNNITILESNFSHIVKNIYGRAIIEKVTDIDINDTSIVSDYDGSFILSSESIVLKNVSIRCGFSEGMSALNITKARSIRILKSYFNNTYETQDTLPGVYIYNSSLFEINDSLIYGYYTGLFIDNSSYFRINGTKMGIHVTPHPSEPSNAAVYIEDTNIFLITNSKLNGTFVAQGVFNVTVENVSVLNESFYNIFAGALINITNVSVSRPLAVDSILEGFETIHIVNSHLKEKDVYYGPIRYYFNVTDVASLIPPDTGEAIIIHCSPVDISGIPAVELSRTNYSRLSDVSYSFLIGYSHNITVENSDTKSDFFNMLYLVDYVNISDSDGNYVTFNSTHGLMENMAMYMTSFEDSYNWTVRNVYNAISFSIKTGSEFFIENITGMSPPPPDSTIMMYLENVTNVNITKIESMVVQIMSSQGCKDRRL